VFLEEVGDFLRGEWAAVSQLAGLDVLHLASELGSGGILELWGLNADLLPGEELGDDVELGWLHAAGGKGADETTEALLGLAPLLVGEHGEGGILVLSLLGRPLAVARGWTATEESTRADSGTNTTGDGSEGNTLDPDSLSNDGSSDGSSELGGDHVEGAKRKNGTQADLWVHDEGFGVLFS